jgi:hypothetical protein
MVRVCNLKLESIEKCTIGLGVLPKIIFVSSMYSLRSIKSFFSVILNQRHFLWTGGTSVSFDDSGQVIYLEHEIYHMY